MRVTQSKHMHEYLSIWCTCNTCMLLNKCVYSKKKTFIKYPATSHVNNVIKCDKKTMYAIFFLMNISSGDSCSCS